jgi:hypothetical protein
MDLEGLEKELTEIAPFQMLKNAIETKTDLLNPDEKERMITTVDIILTVLGNKYLPQYKNFSFITSSLFG